MEKPFKINIPNKPSDWLKDNIQRKKVPEKFITPKQQEREIELKNTETWTIWYRNSKKFIFENHPDLLDFKVLDDRLYDNWTMGLKVEESAEKILSIYKSDIKGQMNRY